MNFSFSIFIAIAKILRYLNLNLRILYKIKFEYLKLFAYYNAVLIVEISDVRLESLLIDFIINHFNIQNSDKI